MKLKEVRLGQGIWQEELANAVGTDVPMISKFEGYKCLPTPDQMDRICAFLKCDVLDIYEPKEITFRRPRKMNVSDEYKVTVRLPKAAKNKIARALAIVGYDNLTAWIRACYKDLIDQAEKKTAVLQHDGSHNEF